MNAWAAVSIGDLGRVVTGATPKSSEPDSWGGCLDFITPSDQEAGKRRARPARRLSQTGADRFERRIVPANSTCFTCIGSTIGKVTLTADRAVTNQQINSVIPNDLHDGRFIYYLLLHRSRDITQIASGSATPIINKTHFSNFTVHAPGLSTQQAIAEVLGALDDKIELNEGILASVDDLIRSLYVSALSEPGARKIPVFDGLEIVFGAPFVSSAFNSERRGRPLLRIRDLKTFEPQVWTTQQLDKEVVVEAGDTVAGMDAEFRPTFWLGEPALLNQRVMHVRSRVGGGSPLCREALRTPLEQAENYKTGTTVAHLNKSDLDALYLDIPGVDAVASFQAAAQPLHERIVVSAAESHRLTALRDTLLPQLMSGKLRVREAEKIVEDAV